MSNNQRALNNQGQTSLSLVPNGRVWETCPVELQGVSWGFAMNGYNPLVTVTFRWARALPTCAPQEGPNWAAYHVAKTISAPSPRIAPLGQSSSYALADGGSTARSRAAKAICSEGIPSMNCGNFLRCRPICTNQADGCLECRPHCADPSAQFRRCILRVQTVSGVWSIQISGRNLQPKTRIHYTVKI